MNEELKVLIKAETSNFKKGLDEAKKETKTFKERVKEASKDVDDSIKKAGDAVVSAGKVMAVGLAAAAAAVVALVASTKEFRQTQAQLQTAFEAAGGSAEEATETYNALYRVLGDSGQAGEAAQHLAKLTTDSKELSEWATVCQGVYATFGASLPIESLTEAANETAKVGTLTGALADALNWAGINEDTFNEQLAACNDEAEREALIRETLTGLYGEAAASYETNAAGILAQNEAQASLDASLASIAETLEPLVAKFTEFAAEVLTELAAKLQEVWTWINENSVVLGVIAGVIGTVVAAIGLYNTVQAVKAAMDAAQVTTIWGLVAAHAAQAAAAMVALAPYLLIVAAIAAVIAVIVLCIEYWDEICAAVEKAVDFIVEWVTGLWESITEGVAAAWDAVCGVLSGICSWIYDTVIKPVADFFSGLWDGFKNAAVNAWNGIKNVFSKVADFFRDIFKNAWEKVKAVFSVGGKIFDGIKDGIVNAFKTVVNAIIKGINKVVAIPFDGINWALRKIRDIEILGYQPFSWISELNVPQIPLLARGGVVNGATLAMVGEAGAEAVVPLENNLEWLDKLAQMLNDRMGGGRPIVLKVGEKTLAETTFSAWNNYVAQTGSCPVKVW